ncbi:phosphonoacetaldehyde hydrolase [Rummeliibacillus pycnus]|uniref:phosphonoacetaldehyde hydrolase n=1 Tax=Rummeliibacillus pycnus TaxID=101070 RepID=UPI000C9C0FCA|nr:phosphonoacetaldehyde hydrolase [Rummeliibacillus pycnus]
MAKIEAVILDWAGTTVDFGCFAPVNVFVNIFKTAGIDVSIEEARKPMGMLKIDHIRTMLEMSRIQEEWQNRYNRPSNEEDVNTLYAQFEEELMATLATYTDPIPTVIETIAHLKEKGIKIGSTTGYTASMMEVVTKHAKLKGYTPDYLVTPDDTNNYGRPYPYMIFHNLEALNVSSVTAAIKVGDTVSDMKEAVNAGIPAVGVIIGSSEMGLTQEEFLSLSNEQKNEIIKKVRATFLENGASYTIDTMADLLPLIDQIEEKQMQANIQ